jgi:predicted ATPase
MRLAREQGFPLWVAYSAIPRAWVLVRQGQAREGIEQINQGLMDYRATGAEINRSYFLALLAEVHGTMGQPEAGLVVLTEALTFAETTGERWYEPELYRLKGGLLLQQSSNHQGEAETCFQQAMAIAQNQQAKSVELVLPPAWLASGSSKANVRTPRISWHRSMPGSPKGLIRRT